MIKLKRCCRSFVAKRYVSISVGNENFNFAKDTFDKWVSKSPTRIALWLADDEGVIKKSFDEICADSNKIANILKEEGIKKGDFVKIILPRYYEWWPINLACIRIGAVFCPGTTLLTTNDIKLRFEKLNPKCIITTSDLAKEINNDKSVQNYPSVISKIFVGNNQVEGWKSLNIMKTKSSSQFETTVTKNNDPICLYFTSGTTGLPKMVIHTQESYGKGHYITGKYWLDLKENDLLWNISDTGWAKAAWSSFFAPWIQGTSIFVYHSEKFDPVKALEILGEYPITVLCAPPTVYRLFVLQNLKKFQFQHLRHCVSAGEPLNPEVINKWQSMINDIIIRDGYGQTETVLLCGNFKSIPPKFGSMGKPSPGIRLCVIGENNEELEVGEVGDVAIKMSPNKPLGLFSCYWKDEEGNQKCFRGDYYITGDKAFVDKDGYFWFESRRDDIIITAGYRVGPFEVENALIQHNAVAESAAVSSPDDIRGAIIKAFIVLKPGVQPKSELATELQEFVKLHTAPYKYPRKIEFVQTLPKTISGKIRRAELRALEWKDAKSS